MTHRILLSILTIAVSLALAACGVNASAAHSTPPVDKYAAMVAYAQCMRQHGVDMPDPGSGSGGGLTLNANGIDQTTLQAAQTACRSKLPKGSTPSAAQQTQMRDKMLRFTACMRQHGVDMPDPQFNNNGGAMVQQSSGGLDPTSATFQAAQRACQSLLPNGGRGLTTRSSGGQGSSGANLSTGGQ